MSRASRWCREIGRENIDARLIALAVTGDCARDATEDVLRKASPSLPLTLDGAYGEEQFTVEIRRICRRDGVEIWDKTPVAFTRRRADHGAH